MYENICQAKPVKFNINLYLNLLSTWDSKSRSSFNIRQALSSIQSVLNSLQIDRCSLIFTTLLLHVTILTIFTKFSSADFMRHSLLLYRSIFSPPYFWVQRSLQVFSIPRPFNHFRLLQGTSEQGIDRDNRAQNHWFLITKAHKDGLLQLLASDKDPCNQNGKPSNLSSLQLDSNPEPLRS